MGGVSAAWVGNRSRTIGLSVVCSGFLTLFTTFISDSTLATVFAYAWGAICLWWLVANHWEQVESCVAIQVKPAKGQRLIVIVLGCIAILSTTLLVSNRVPVLRRLQAELMPTSGGTGDKDSAARSGVTISQLGMMFAHGNSPGAAFRLLLLGTGVNLATLCWIAWNNGWKPMAVWCTSLFGLVLACAYAVDRPLIPPGIEPAGHTHAFDIYTNPFQQNTSLSLSLVLESTTKSIGWAEFIGLGITALLPERFWRKCDWRERRC